ncbi:MAG: hypothetical protein AB7D27_14680 [Desulfomicrobium sp.]
MTIEDVTISPDAEAQTAEPDEQQQGEPSAPEEEAQEQQAQAEEGEDQGGEGEGEPAGKKNAVQKRIDEITRARREAEGRAKHLEQVLYNVTQRQQVADVQAQQLQDQPAEQPPKPEDFQDVDSFQRAVARFEARQEVRAEMKAEAERQQSSQRQAAQAREQQESQQRAVSMVESGREAFEDFDDVVMAPGVRITPVMADAMSLDAKTGSSVAYYLGKSPEESARIASMKNPLAQAVEIGRLSEKIASAANKNKVTKAAPPAKPLGGRAKVNVDEAKLSDAEWLRQRHAKR